MSLAKRPNNGRVFASLARRFLLPTNVVLVSARVSRGVPGASVVISTESDHPPSQSIIMPKATAKSTKKSEVKFRAKKKSPRKRRTWKESFQELAAFRRQHGHCNVPHRGDNRSLGQWVSKQKRIKDDLSSEQVEQLNGIDFNWAKQADSFQQNWNNNFDKLKQFKRKHGHMKVPITYEEDPALAIWVAEQRKLYRKEKLSDDRKNRLDELGMIWYIHDHYERSTSFSDNCWKDMMDQMKQFHQANGHCLVPRDYSEQKKLASWENKVSRGRVGH